MQFLFLMLTGLALGAANIVPGVSGATLAVIFRIYDKLIESINSLVSDTKKSLVFLIPVGIGMAVGILVVGTLLDGLFDRFSFQTSALIAGLIAGGIPYIYSLAISKDDKKPVYYVIAAIAAIVIILLAVAIPTPVTEAAGEFSWGFAALLFFSGVAVAAALITPGVSGAMMLMLFGLLPTVMHTISLITDYLRTPFDFGLLPPIMQVAVPLGLGMVIGILLASRIIAYLLKKHFTVTYFAILGMVIGSIFVVFSNPDTYASVDRMTAGLVVVGVIAFVVGAAIALIFASKQPAREDTTSE